MEVTEPNTLIDFAPKPKIFVRYVDDCFCIINRNDAPRLLLLNSAEATIQFTAEYECCSGLLFLDVEVNRTRTSLSFAVHRKATHTRHYLNFNSCHPACHKQSVTSSLVERATRICSGDDDMRKELQTIHQELLMSGYPEKFIKNVEDRVLNPRPPQGKSFRRRVGIHTFLGSAKLSHIFARYDLRVAHMPSYKLRNQIAWTARDTPVLSTRYHVQTAAAVTSAKLATSSGDKRTSKGRGQEQESAEHAGRARQ